MHSNCHCKLGDLYLEVWGRHALPGGELGGVDLAPVAPALVGDHDGTHGILLVLALKHLGNLNDQLESDSYRMRGIGLSMHSSLIAEHGEWRLHAP